jgi:hypothetical protein
MRKKREESVSKLQTRGPAVGGYQGLDGAKRESIWRTIWRAASLEKRKRLVQAACEAPLPGFEPGFPD